MSNRRRIPACLLACLVALPLHAGPNWGAPTLEAVQVRSADSAGLHGGGQIQLDVRLAGGGLTLAPLRVDLRIQIEGIPTDTVTVEARCPLRGCRTGYNETLTYRLPAFCVPATRDLRVQASAGGMLRETSARIQAAPPARANLAVRQPRAARPEFSWTVRESATHCPASGQVLCVGPQPQVADVSAPLCRERNMVRAFRFAQATAASFALPEALDFSGAAVAVLAQCDGHGRCVPSLPVYFVVP